VAKTKPKRKQKKRTRRTGVKTHKFDDRKQKKYVELIGKGVGRLAAAKAVGIGPTSVLYERDKNPEFVKAVSEAEMMATDVIENAVWRKAKAGNITACIFWLLNRRSDKWKDLRNHGGQDGQGGVTMQTMVKVLNQTFHVKADGSGDKGVRKIAIETTKTGDGNGNGNGNGT
jgi:hypothetical protein